MTSLSLSADIQYIIKFVGSFDRLILLSQTGSGKSTLFPTILASTGESVWIAIDTDDSIISSIADYARKSFTKDEKYPNIIHAMEPINVVHPGTVIYSNRDILAKNLNSIMSTLDIVIIDDAHIDDLNGLAIVNSIRFYRDVVSDIQFPKLILTSAEEIAIPHEEFGIMDLRKIEPSYTIDIRYHGTLESDLEFTSVITKYVDSSAFTRGKHFLLFVDDVVKYGKLLDDTFNKNFDDDTRNFAAWKSQQSDKLRRPKDVNILIIRSVSRDLANLGDVSTIIISGPELSNAVTIPEVSVVFDLIKKKISLKSIFDSNLAASFGQSYITKMEANQRKGRTGRTNDGICYRFCSEQFFDNLSDTSESYPDSEPNLLSCARLIDYGLNPSIVYDAPLGNMIEETARIGLTELNSLSRNGNDYSYLTTEMYTFVEDSKLSVESGVVLWHLFNTEKINVKERTALFAIACIETLDSPRVYYNYPHKYNMSDSNYVISTRKFKQIMYERYAGRDDLESTLNALAEESGRKLKREDIVERLITMESPITEKSIDTVDSESFDQSLVINQQASKTTITEKEFPEMTYLASKGDRGFRSPTELLVSNTDFVNSSAPQVYNVKKERMKAIFETYNYLTDRYGVSSAIPLKFNTKTIQAVRRGYQYVGEFDHTKIITAILVDSRDIPIWRGRSTNFIMSDFSITRTVSDRPLAISILSHTGGTIDNLLMGFGDITFYD